MKLAPPQLLLDATHHTATGSMPSNGSVHDTEPPILDQLFDAIQHERQPDIEHILQKHPDIINKQNIPDVGCKISPQMLLDEDKLGNLMTQDVLRKRGQMGQTIQVQHYGAQCPLHVACLFGNVDAVKTLLEKSDIDLNVSNASKEGPLGIACRAAQLRIAQLLLEKSEKLDSGKEIQLDHQDDVGNTPIHYLACRGIYPLWSQNPSDEDLENTLKLMLKVAKSNEFHRLCMEIVCKLGSTHLLSILLKLDPEAIHLENKNGWRALHHAIDSSEKEAVKILLEADARYDVRTKSPPTPDAQIFAFVRKEYEIGFMIDDWVDDHLNVVPPDDGQDSQKAWIWPRNIIPGERAKAAKDYEVEEHAISAIIREVQKLQPKTEEAIWCHFPENDWVWLKDLYGSTLPDETSNKSTLEFLQKIFGFSKQKPPFCDYGYSSVPRKNATTENKSQECPPVVVTVLPVIDINLQDEYIKKDGQESRPGLHPPCTLDHYYHPDLEKNRQLYLNKNQVFTRYFEYLEELSRINMDSTLEAQHSADGSQPYAEGKSNGGKSSPKRILVVSQLWLVQTNKLLVTLFPQRQNITFKDSNPHEQDQEGEDEKAKDPQKEEQQDTSPEKGYQLLDIIQRGFKGTRDIMKTYHDMVKTSMIYQATIQDEHNESKTYTYLDIFSKEILRISLDLDKCFQDFISCFGKSDKNFRELSKEASKCLIAINDVVNEIEIIKQIYDHRVSVWKDIHTQRSENKSPSETIIPRQCSWGFEDCNPYLVKVASYGDAEKIEQRAKAVQKKADSLMALLYGQAGTENTIRTSEQARYLAIFTVVTVVFSPLSFVTSLLALEIDSFSPNRWTRLQVAGGSLLGVLITLALCLVGYVWMKHKEGQEKFRKKTKAPIGSSH